ncbi:MAG TPA: hypothetical protein ENI99_09745 [Sedimenticola sp.]|nr:hypothetical protein [Sedimenticola sp.]
MGYSIGIVPYTNMRPYSLVPPPAGCDLVQLSPRHAVRAFNEGRLSAAAIPVGGLDAIEGQYAFLSSFGISARGRVGSVLLFSRRPLGQLGDGCTLSLSGESVTSNRLLYLLLGYERGFDNLPRLARPGGQADAELVIGDAALQRLHHAPAPHVIDLAQHWWQRHGLPFVFARWVIRRDAPEALKQSLSDWLERVSARRDQWSPRVAQEAAMRIGITPEAAEAYLHGIHYRIDAAAQQGQMLFQQELKRHARPALFSPAPVMEGMLQGTGSLG